MQFYYTINTKFVIICEKKRGDVCMKIDWRLFDGEEIVIEEMEHAYRMHVPLKADCGWGKNWLEAH